MKLAIIHAKVNIFSLTGPYQSIDQFLFDKAMEVSGRVVNVKDGKIYATKKYRQCET